MAGGTPDPVGAAQNTVDNLQKLADGGEEALRDLGADGIGLLIQANELLGRVLKGAQDVVRGQ